MKNMTIISLFAAIVLSFTACSSTQKAPQKVVSKVVEDHETEAYNFPEGIYYAYQFEGDRPAYDFNVEALVEQLATAEIPVKNMWYKGASSSCTPPGSSMSMSVVVDAVLIIQTTATAEKVRDLGFQRTTAPTMGQCAYRVSRYVF